MSDKTMREALEKIADLNGIYGPFPEANSKEWGAMAIVTAREALASAQPEGPELTGEEIERIEGDCIERVLYEHPVKGTAFGQRLNKVKFARAVIAADRAARGQAWTVVGGDYDRAIHHNPDARAWADFFMATFPNCGADRDTMVGWFANAMMAMHDSKSAADRAARAEPVAWCWVSDGKPTVPVRHGKGPDEDIIKLAAARDNPVTVRYFYTAPPAAPVVPDSEAVAMLRKLYKASVRILEAGRDTIVALGGQCDPVDQMESDDPTLREVRTMLAAPTLSCSQSAKKSTCEAGRVDETGKSEHVGGAA